MVTTRQAAAHRATLRLKEVELQTLVGAIFAAAGAEDADARAKSIRLVHDEQSDTDRLPSTEMVEALFGNSVR